MQLAARTGAWAKSGAPLPPGVVEIDYLEVGSAANSYIDTLLKGWKYSWKFSITASCQSNEECGFFFGGIPTNVNSSSYGRLSMAFFSPAPNNFSYTNGEWKYARINVDRSNFHAYTISNPDGLYIDGTYAGASQTLSHPDFAALDSPSLFCYSFMNNDGTKKNYYSPSKFTRIKDAKIWDDSDNLVLDMIPVRIGDVGYMFDSSRPNAGPTGNGLFPNTNAKGAPFILGPDKTT